MQARITQGTGPQQRIGVRFAHTAAACSVGRAARAARIVCSVRRTVVQNLFDAEPLGARLAPRLLLRAARAKASKPQSQVYPRPTAGSGWQLDALCWGRKSLGPLRLLRVLLRRLVQAESLRPLRPATHSSDHSPRAEPAGPGGCGVVRVRTLLRASWSAADIPFFPFLPPPPPPSPFRFLPLPSAQRAQHPWSAGWISCAT